MTKIVINNCFGGFGLSDEALKLYFDLNDIKYKETNRKHSWMPNYHDN